MNQQEPSSPTPARNAANSSDRPRNDPTRAAAFEAGQAAADNRWLLYVLGGISLLAGILAIVMPFVASLAATMVFGMLLLVAGIFGLFAAFRRRDYWQVASALGLALLSIITGVLMFLQPIAGIYALTTLIIAWLAASGILRLYYGIRQSSERGSGWMIVAGLGAILVAVLLWFGLPFNAVWLPGLILGLDLLFWGVLLLVLASPAGTA